MKPEQIKSSLTRQIVITTKVQTSSSIFLYKPLEWYNENGKEI